MKIAQIAPVIERVPPKKYGGIERMVSALTEELVKRGHEVTLYASGDSQTSARLRSVYPRSLREARLRDIYSFNHWTLLNIGMAYAEQHEFDILHDHIFPTSLPVANIAEKPVVMTMHGPFTPENRKIAQSLRRPHIVTASNAQVIPNINHAGTIYHGLSFDNYPFSAEPEDYLLFVGRICMEKGTHHAIEVAQELDMPLIIAAKLDSVDRPYFREYVEPHLSERIQWVGEVENDERNRLMSKAFCFLHPVTWREPFGLTLIEAMACGCPVVAFNKGSIPELVRAGETGYVVEDVESMIDAVEGIKDISRETCRTHALTNFNAQKMADAYETLYQQILSEKESGRAAVIPPMKNEMRL